MNLIRDPQLKPHTLAATQTASDDVGMGLSIARPAQAPSDRISITMSAIQRPRDLDLWINRDVIPYAGCHVEARAWDNHSIREARHHSALGLPDQWIDPLEEVIRSQLEQLSSGRGPNHPPIKHSDTTASLPITSIVRLQFVPPTRGQVEYPSPVPRIRQCPERIPPSHKDRGLELALVPCQRRGLNHSSDVWRGNHKRCIALQLVNVIVVADPNQLIRPSHFPARHREGSRDPPRNDRLAIEWEWHCARVPPNGGPLITKGEEPALEPHTPPNKQSLLDGERVAGYARLVEIARPNSP